MAPNGRTKKPAAKAPSVNTNPAVWLPPVNTVEIVDASVPNRKKSYHSNAVPTDDAATTIDVRRPVPVTALAIRWERV